MMGLPCAVGAEFGTWVAIGAASAVILVLAVLLCEGAMVRQPQLVRWRVAALLPFLLAGGCGAFAWQMSVQIARYNHLAGDTPDCLMYPAESPAVEASYHRFFSGILQTLNHERLAVGILSALCLALAAVLAALVMRLYMRRSPVIRPA